MNWEQVEPTLREQAYAVINNDPQVLLETEGGPLGEKADVVMARLLGFDDQIDHDGWRLPRVEAVLLTPILEPLPVIAAPIDPYAPMRTATYRLQSNYAKVRITAEHAPPDVVPGPDFMIDVLYLRYRRSR